MLVLSRNYPNPGLPALGMWAERMAVLASGIADVTVIAPVPWVPPLPGRMARRFRAAPPREDRSGVPVHHPRVPIAPGHALQTLEARMMWPAVRRAADALHRERPFDLIHAHFIYPDGVLAARLGQRYGIPVMTTEHALWQPWLDRRGAVRRQVLDALPHLAVVSVVSDAVGRSVRAVGGDRLAVEVLPNVVDESAFREPADGEPWDPNQILFVGAVRHVKGLDLLVHSLPRVRARFPEACLTVVGEAFYREWRRDELAVRRLVRDLGLDPWVRFAGAADAAGVAAAMRRSAVLVVPSRRESFSAVAIEALASGTPVVATRCGGPEDFLTPDTGRLVPPEDPGALAAAIVEVMDHRAGFDRASLRAYAVARYGREAGLARLHQLYAAVSRPSARVADTPGSRTTAESKRP